MVQRCTFFTSLTLVHSRLRVRQQVDSRSCTEFPGISLRSIDDLQAAAWSRLRELLTGFAIDGEAIAMSGSAAQTIVDHAWSTPAELIVVGTHGRTGLVRLTDRVAPFDDDSGKPAQDNLHAAFLINSTSRAIYVPCANGHPLYRRREFPQPHPQFPPDLHAFIVTESDARHT